MRRFKEFVMIVGYDEFVEKLNISEEITMKSLFERFGGTYRKERDYAIPNLKTPDTGNFEIGIWGQQHLYFLFHYRKVTYINLLTSGKLNAYLVKIGRQAQDRFFRIVAQMKQEQEITEQSKANTPVEWIGKMNCIKQQAEEIVFNEMIYK